MLRPCILLLEDDTATREGLSTLLEDAGYSVIQAPDGQEAVNLLASGLHVDLLLIDLLTPRVSGVDVLRYVREDAVLREVPIVVTTGVNRADVHVAADVIFEKPYDVKMLLQTIQRLRPPSSVTAR